MDYSKLVCRSTNIYEHIKRAYYRSMLCYTAGKPLEIYPDPKDYGYKTNDSGMLVPQIFGVQHGQQICHLLVLVRNVTA